ncbi:CAHM6 protein, partial [Locustella ochotensis]|nr:CAHM6 protein [Locustella ochotensis]
MNYFHKIVDFCVRNQTVLGCTTVSLLTVVSEYIFSSVVFKCPCNSKNMLYGSSFLLAPAFVLFVLGYMVNPTTWHLLTGKCSPKKKGKPRRTCTYFCQVLLPLTAKASVAPLTWIAVALLGAEFYECAASGSSLLQSFLCKDNGTECRDNLLKMPCNAELSAKIPRELRSLHVQSQLIGWFLIAGIMTVVLISTCVRRCCAPGSYLQQKFYKIYSKTEEELFETKAKEHATELAERNINSFFAANFSAQFPTPKKHDWQNISAMYTINSEGEYYSMLHRYLSTKTG